MSPLMIAVAVLCGALGALLMLQFMRAMRVQRKAEAVWNALVPEPHNDLFSEEHIAGLPQPVQRYFRNAIADGTAIAGAATMRINGTMRLKPGGPASPFSSQEKICAGRGFVWPAVLRMGLIPVVGHDMYFEGRGEMQWRLFGIFAVAEASGEEVSESAAARLAAELIWLPAMLLPEYGGNWTAEDENNIRCRVGFDGYSFTLHLHIDAEGAVQRVRMQRLRNLDDGSSQAEQFGMDSEGEITSGGYTIPAKCKVAWNPDDPDKRFEFWQGEIKEIEYI